MAVHKLLDISLTQLKFRRMAEEQELIVVCSCSRLDHAVRFTTWSDEKCIYVDVGLDNEPWYKRVVTALRYVFFDQCGYGKSAQIILEEEAVSRLRSWLDSQHN